MKDDDNNEGFDNGVERVRGVGTQRASKRSEDGRMLLLVRGDPVIKHPKKGNPRAAILGAKYRRQLEARKRKNAAMVVVQQSPGGIAAPGDEGSNEQ